MSGHDLLTFDEWVRHEFARTQGFSALVVLVRIGETSVTPLRSTYVHVIGDEITWPDVEDLMSSAKVQWDGVMFSSIHNEMGGGPVTDILARSALSGLVAELEQDRLVLNRNHFFDRWGRRMKIEEVTSH